MIDIIANSYWRYVKQYNKRPNLFFTNKKTFIELLREQPLYNSDIDPYTSPILSIYGCTIIRVFDDNGFNYSFFELEDLLNVRYHEVLWHKDAIGLPKKVTYEEASTLVSADPKYMTLVIPTSVLRAFFNAFSQEGLTQEKVLELKEKFDKSRLELRL